MWLVGGPCASSWWCYWCGPFELAKNFLIFYLERFTSFDNVYGGLAPVIVMLLSTYLSSLILGAELSFEYGLLRVEWNAGSCSIRRTLRWLVGSRETLVWDKGRWRVWSASGSQRSSDVEVG